MPVYIATDPSTGRRVKMTGPAPPSEALIRKAFDAIGAPPKEASVFDSTFTKGKRLVSNLVGAYDPASAMMGAVGPLMAANTELGPMAKAVVDKAKNSPVGQAASKVIKAFHGSPHDFDAFSTAKIGTGEGAQAYGHGLYFAENEATAKAYREQLAGGVDKLIGGEAYDSTRPDHLAAHYVEMFSKRGKSRDEIAKLLREEGGTPAHAKAADIVLGGETAPVQNKPRGHTYEVNIHADPDAFLDWDAPLSKQSEAVKKAPSIQRMLAQEAAYKERYPSGGLGERHGSNVYDDLGNVDTPKGFDKAAAAARLRAEGIPGIKYLDQGSRATGEGTRNYVVFDDKLVSIVKKYMLAGFGLEEAMRQAMQSQQGQGK